MRRRAVLTGSLATLPLLTSACDFSASTKPHVKREPIVIGVNLELSGPGAIIPQLMVRGLLMQLDSINNDGGVHGREVKLLTRNNKQDPKLAVKIAKEFADQHVAGMIGPMLPPQVVALVGVPEKLRLPTIAEASTDIITSPASQHRYTFRVPPTGAEMAIVQAQALARRKVKYVGFLTTTDPSNDSAIAGFKTVARKAGVKEVIVQRFSPTATNLMPQVQAAQEAGATGFAGVGVFPPQSVILAKTIKATGFDGPVIFGAAAGVELFVEGAGRAAEGMYMVYGKIMASDSEAVTTPTAWRQRQFFTEYARKYGQFSGFATLGADGLQLMVNAIHAAGSTAPQRVQHALEHTTLDGLAGRYVYSPTSHGGMTQSSIVVLKVTDGRWVLSE